jgi:UDP-N-acetylglucosamine--N-acetylmuramyl-(pentapeptide) pyrophosphoryl-undecaprenol N-acetylglucosamine transferase
MKVIIAGGGTGGHLFPAVAVGEEIMRQEPWAAVKYVGASNGIEARWMPGRGFAYELLSVRGLRGHRFVERLRAVPEFMRATLRAQRILRDFGADVVLSAGGYASVPMALAAVTTGTPLVLMEQNTRPGLANRVFRSFAVKICVGFEETARYFDRKRVEVTGNPIRGVDSEALEAAVKDPSKSQILVLGGSSGAHRLNFGVLNAFKKIGKDVIKISVLHQTGEADAPVVTEGYREIGWVDAKVTPFLEDVPKALANADLVVARAGAMTVSEVALVGRPAIFVPYPFHRDRQQEHNARVLESRGAAIIVPDDECLGDNLGSAIAELISDRARLEAMSHRARTAAIKGSAQRIARICAEVAKARAQQ